MCQMQNMSEILVEQDKRHWSDISLWESVTGTNKSEYKLKFRPDFLQQVLALREKINLQSPVYIIISVWLWVSLILKCEQNLDAFEIGETGSQIAALLLAVNIQT